MKNSPCFNGIILHGFHRENNPWTESMTVTKSELNLDNLRDLHVSAHG